MPKSDEVSVFWRDQDLVCERPAFSWPRSECRAKKNIVGTFIDNGKSFRLFALRPKIYPVTAADLRTSNHLPEACTISLSETLANVGIAGLLPGEPAPRHIVKRAQAKIRVYDHVHDDQAVLGHGRWYASENIQVVAIQ